MLRSHKILTCFLALFACTQMASGAVPGKLEGRLKKAVKGEALKEGLSDGEMRLEGLDGLMGMEGIDGLKGLEGLDSLSAMDAIEGLMDKKSLNKLNERSVPDSSTASPQTTNPESSTVNPQTTIDPMASIQDLNNTQTTSTPVQHQSSSLCLRWVVYASYCGRRGGYCVHYTSASNYRVCTFPCTYPYIIYRCCFN